MNAPPSSFSRTLLPWLPILAAVATAAVVLRRELWFDEALTVTNFMLVFSPAEIYRNYLIPNNQIVYTIVLKLWHGLLPEAAADPVAFWRLPSLLAALAFMGLFLRFRRETEAASPLPAVVILLFFATSALFQNYATAIRGYALSWLWIMLSLYGLRGIFREGKRRYRLLYFGACCAAVGTVPTNLLALAGAVLYALPWCRRDFWRDGRFYFAAAAPFLALAVFYGPILPAFLRTFTLNEGFAGRLRALAVIYGMAAATFGALLAGEWFRRRGASDRRERLRGLIWLLPVPAVLLLHQAPFPRVFVTLYPVLMMLLADGWEKVHWPRRKLAAALAAALLLQVLLRLLAPAAAARAGLSVYEDDGFRPWYMVRGYGVSAVVPELEKRPECRTVFLSFNSDPCPILFYAALRGVERDFRPDLPYGRVAAAPPGSLLILRADEDPGDFVRRFGRELTAAGEAGGLRLFRAGARPDGKK